MDGNNLGSVTREDLDLKNQNLAERMRTLLKSGRGSDISIRVGIENETKVFEVHKAVLASSSAAFNSMFFGESAGDVILIEETGWKAITFEKMLEYIYCDAINYSNIEEALDILKIAKYYEVSSLITKCKAYVIDNITASNVLTFISVFESEEEYIDVLNKCIEVISIKWKSMKEDKKLLEVKPSTLELLLDQDGLKVESEMEVLEFLLRWAESQCVKENLSVNTENKRKVLGSALKKVRFLAMCMYDFISMVELRDLLEAEVYRDILIKLVKNTSANYPPGFSTKGRRKYQSFVNCFQCKRCYIPFQSDEVKNFKSFSMNKTKNGKQKVESQGFNFSGFAPASDSVSRPKRMNPDKTVSSSHNSAPLNDLSSNVSYFSSSSKTAGAAATTTTVSSIKPVEPNTFSFNNNNSSGKKYTIFGQVIDNKVHTSIFGQQPTNNVIGLNVSSSNVPLGVGIINPSDATVKPTATPSSSTQNAASGYFSANSFTLAATHNSLSSSSNAHSSASSVVSSGSSIVSSSSSTLSSGNGPLYFSNSALSSGSNAFSSCGNTLSSVSKTFSSSSNTLSSGDNTLFFGVNNAFPFGGNTFASGGNTHSSSSNTFVYGDKTLSSGSNTFSFGSCNTFSSGGNKTLSSVANTFPFGGNAVSFGGKPLSTGGNNLPAAGGNDFSGGNTAFSVAGSSKISAPNSNTPAVSKVLFACSNVITTDANIPTAGSNKSAMGTTLALNKISVTEEYEIEEVDDSKEFLCKEEKPLHKCTVFENIENDRTPTKCPHCGYVNFF